MPGAPLQVAAYGRHDVLLVGNPQFTYMKKVVRRHTPFATESIPSFFDGNVSFGQTLTTEIKPSGDMLGTLWLELKLPETSLSDIGTTGVWVNGLGCNIVEYALLEIAGREIVRLPGEWMHLWGQLATSASKMTIFRRLMGYWSAGDDWADQTASATLPAKTLNIPLPFWFCADWGRALPIIAMQQSPIRLHVKLREFRDLVYSTGLVSGAVTKSDLTLSTNQLTSATLWADYAFLDVPERRRFVANAHEYLVEQVQVNPETAVGAGAFTATVPLDIRYPVKELIWVVQQERMKTFNDWFNYTNLATSAQDANNVPIDLYLTAILRWDGADRFQARDPTYFRDIQPYLAHTNSPSNLFASVYSFAAKPEEMQPSGHWNASLFANKILHMNLDRRTTDLSTKPLTVRTYALNYNVLRIVAGQCALLFAA
jgi:hypothetical protein